MKRVMLPLAEQNIMEFYPYTTRNGKLYQLIESEDELWELHIEDIH